MPNCTLDKYQSASECVAVVVIGRNEGTRLVRCLQSLRSEDYLTVYVDSGSTDASIANARSVGAEVVALAMDQPFTAARARNAGFNRAVSLRPHTEHVQFVDGDCEVHPEWIERACLHLRANLEVAAVIGTQRERHPERSIYNQLCDMEWRWPVGEIKALPGNMMARVPAFQEIHGFREDLIAAEDTELAVRLRAQGWRLHAIKAPMTTHDANILHVSHWWKRTTRAGYAFAEGVDLHGAAPERHFVREKRRAIFWGLLLPITTAITVLIQGPAGLLLLLLPVVQILRIFIRVQGTFREKAVYSSLTILGKPAEALGVLRYLYLRHRGRRSALIEYK